MKKLSKRNLPLIAKPGSSSHFVCLLFRSCTMAFWNFMPRTLLRISSTNIFHAKLLLALFIWRWKVLMSNGRLIIQKNIRVQISGNNWPTKKTPIDSGPDYAPVNTQCQIIWKLNTLTTTCLFSQPDHPLFIANAITVDNTITYSVTIWSFSSNSHPWGVMRTDI